MDAWPWRRGPGAAPAELTGALRHRPAAGLLATLLWRRGVEAPDDAEAFLTPTLARGLRQPGEIPGVAGAGARLAEAIRAGRPVEIAAGTLPAVVAAAVLAEWVRGIGGDVRAGAAGPRVAVLDDALRVDAEVATTRGLSPVLAPAGLAFYVLAAARTAGRTAGLRDGPDLRPLLDLVALGTLCSPCELRGENRVLSAVGLARWRDRPRPGLRALAAAALVEPVASRTVVERLVPRLEAAVAAGAAGRVLALLLATRPDEAEREAAALEVAAAGWRAAAAVGIAADGPMTPLLDAEVPLRDLGAGLLLALAALEPHGTGNPEPVFLARDVRVDAVRPAGDPLRPHWRLRLRQEGRTHRATARRLGPPVLAPGMRCDVAYVPRLVYHGGRREVTLTVHALRPSEVGPTPLAGDGAENGVS